MSKSWISPPQAVNILFPFYFEAFTESSCLSTAEDTAPELGRHIPKWASYKIFPYQWGAFCVPRTAIFQEVLYFELLFNSVAHLVNILNCMLTLLAILSPVFTPLPPPPPLPPRPCGKSAKIGAGSSIFGLKS
jgi:hypothetical protein